MVTRKTLRVQKIRSRKLHNNFSRKTGPYHLSKLGVCNAVVVVLHRERTLKFRRSKREILRSGTKLCHQPVAIYRLEGLMAREGISAFTESQSLFDEIKTSLLKWSTDQVQQVQLIEE